MYRWLAVGVVTLAVLLTALWASKRGGSGGRGPGRALVEIHETIPVIRLSGPPRAKGLALGEALRDRIAKELERALPEPAMREFAVGTCGEKLAPFLPEEYREEIGGLAEGAGISFEEALFLDTRFEIAAFGLAEGGGDLPEEGAVGPGPTAACLLASAAARDLVVLVHEDHSPPLVLVARPGMTGGFLGIAGNVAAAMRPMHEETPPTLHGLVWTLLFRRILEVPPTSRRQPPAEMTGPLSVAMLLPDGGAGTLNLAVSGAAWHAAGGSLSLTTDEPVVPREGGAVRRTERDAADRSRVAEAATRLLDGSGPGSGRTRVALRRGEGGVSVVVDAPEGRRTVLLPGTR